MEEISVRRWQEKFRAGAFEDKGFKTQCEAGWYDWFCDNDALAGRLKKIGKVVMGITDPFILDNFYGAGQSPRKEKVGADYRAARL